MAGTRGPWQPGEGPGTVALIGLGKIGLPLAAQYSSSGWRVIGVDVLPEVVDIVGSGGSHVREEPGIAELLSAAHAQGLLSATLSHAEAAAQADVIVFAVPVMLDEQHAPDYGWMDEATAAVGAGLRPGTLVVYETTLPVGTTRSRYRPMLQRASGLPCDGTDRGFHLAFSPERVFSGRVLEDLKRYPKLVGGVDTASSERAMAFYQSVLAADVWDLGTAETAEFAKLAETTYRDVNIALANEFARYADQVGVDILAVIRGANSQPYSHIHQPGIGVGGHCIPVYPHFLLAGDPGLTLVREARSINDGQVDRAVAEVERRLGSLKGVPVLVLGLTYREHVRELAYSRAVPLIHRLQEQRADVWAYDPLLEAADVSRFGARPYVWGNESAVQAIFTQTGDPLWRQLDPTKFSRLRVVYDGRNSLDAAKWPTRTVIIGVGHTLRSSEPRP
jgi:nucleotide sugar dehydrogenase